jgi:hypothetical protein
MSRPSSLVWFTLIACALVACGGSDDASDAQGVAGAAGSSFSAGQGGSSGGKAGSTSGKGGASAGSGGSSAGNAGSSGALAGGGAAGKGGAGGAMSGGSGGVTSGGAGGSAAAGGSGLGGAAGGTSKAGAGGGTGGAAKGGAAGTGGSTSTGGAAGASGAGQGGSSATSSFPTAPIPFTKGKPFTVDSGTTNYVFVPDAYDASHKTPTTLLVWLHGCGGFSSGDIWMVSPGGAQSWISLAVGGQEGNCWDVAKDPARVLAALADIKTHFNIKPKGVVLGGYSSGGDLTYRTAFYNAGLFAGVIVENSSPYRDTGSKEAASLAAAAWKFNAVHLAHLQDTTYPIGGVRTETDSMTAAGFPMKRIEVDGGHYDDPGAIENGHPVPGTSADLVKLLLPYLDAGWTAP